MCVKRARGMSSTNRRIYHFPYINFNTWKLKYYCCHHRLHVIRFSFFWWDEGFFAGRTHRQNKFCMCNTHTFKLTDSARWPTRQLSTTTKLQTKQWSKMLSLKIRALREAEREEWNKKIYIYNGGKNSTISIVITLYLYAFSCIEVD